MIARLQRAIKALLGKVVPDYQINWILAGDAVPEADEHEVIPASPEHYALIAHSATPKVLGSLSYARQGLAGLVVVENGRPASIAHFARAAEYGRHVTWPLKPNEVALMDIATEEAMRGRGLAVSLIKGATRHYRQAGADRVLAFVWWSNHPSLRAFAKAGWRRIGFSLEWQWGGRPLAVRIPLG
ncbi:MAG: GNAT family N-acetyltransferase [Sphingomonadales bacterium]|nr:GNAT family N-acetyltransferase [Sphingomonadales bacterium]